MTSTARRVVVTLAALASIALAGASGVHAAGPDQSPSIGASIESRVFTDDDRALRVYNQSTVAARFDFTASGGWRIVPDHLVLDPSQTSQVVIVGDGADGSPVAITITSNETISGVARSAIELTSRIYHARPFDPSGLIRDVLGAGLVIVAVGLVLRRTRPWQYRLTRSAS